MAKTYTFNIATPAGSDDPTQGDDRIREVKTAIQERMDADHYWALVGNVADVDNDGFHRKVTLLVRTAPTEKADAGILYSKDVSAKAELFYIDEDADEVQLTSGGAALGGPFITGDIILSTVDTAHSGWTDVSATYSNKFIRINATPLTTGGSDTHTHGVGSFAVSGTTGNESDYTTCEAGAQGVASYLHTHSFSSAVSGTSASGDNVPAYVQLVMFQKD